MNRIALITGNTGFMGSHLVREFENRGWKLVVLEKDFDIRKEATVMALPKADLVIHLAAIANVPLSWDKPQEVLEINLIGTANILKYCEINQSKLIYPGSYAYGIPKYLPIDELHPTSAENPYAVSKLAAEELCQVYFKKNGLGTTILRIFNPYGPGQSEKMIISQMISELVQEGKITIFSGKPKRDFLYIDDLVKAFVLAAQQIDDELNIFNIGSGNSWSILEIATKIRRLSGKNCEILDKETERPNDIMDTIANIDKAKEKLGWTPEISIDDGLKRTINWFSQKSE